MKKNIKTQGRLFNTFKRLKAAGGKALIPFITAGDPDIRTTVAMALALERNGSDIIELGIPFSDPMADGPTIQASYERALKKGTRISDCLDAIREIRKKSGIPIVLFGYYNPILQHGLKRFAVAAKKAGVDGVLVVDLPPEEAGEFKDELRACGIDLILLLTPTSNDERIRVVAKNASGFIYFVSVAGVTGARTKLSKDIRPRIQRIREFTDLPIGVGFGVSNAAQARELSRFSDAVIVGSALINVIAKGGSAKDAVKNAGDFVSSLKKGLT